MKRAEDLQDIVAIAERLQAVRKAKGFTQNDMATQMGISCATYIKLENASHGITTRNLMNISRILNVSADLLLFGDTGMRNINFDEYIACAKLFSDDGLDSLAESIGIIRKLKDSGQLVVSEEKEPVTV